MTNAEKFQEIFKEFATEVWAFSEKDFLTWLNAEYKEPITKNDLGVDCISRDDVWDVMQELWGTSGELMDRLMALPSVTLRLTSELETNSKKLEKDFGELDCISRAEAIKCLECDFDITGKENMKTVVNYINSAHDKIVNLPRVKQEPKTGHWIKGYTFPDGEYWKCDKCNELIKVKYPMHYCNNCGSDNER